MAKRLETPEFANEEEEAQWWFANQDLLGEQFEQAGKDGALSSNQGRAVVAHRRRIPSRTQLLEVVSRLCTLRGRSSCPSRLLP